MDRGRSMTALVGALAVSMGLAGVAMPARARVPAAPVMVTLARATVAEVAGRVLDPVARRWLHPVEVTVELHLAARLGGGRPPLATTRTQCGGRARATGAFAFALSGMNLRPRQRLLVRAFPSTDRARMGTQIATLAAAPAPPPAARRVESFTYHLRDLTPAAQEAIAKSGFDLAVVDYSADGSESQELSAQAVRAMKGPDGTRKILCYMSIGEAESYRFYWKTGWVTPDPDTNPDGPFTVQASAPVFLHSSNPKWPNNFKARFWDPSWKQIIISNPGGNPYIGAARSYLDRIIEAGFDGVYLDIVDAYEFFGPTEEGGNGERLTAAADMMEFIEEIARHARTTRGRKDFLVFPQNATGILKAVSPERARAYLSAIDGIGNEDVYHYGEHEENNALNVQEPVLDNLRAFKDAGKLLLAIEYLSPDKQNPAGLAFPAVINEYYARARRDGFVPYATVRALDRMVVNPSQAPRRASD